MTGKKTEKNTNSGSRANSLFSVLVLAVLFSYLFIVSTHRFWLPLAADFLVLANQPRHADLIVVATPFRPRFLHALNLLQKGYADQILLVGDARIKTLWDDKTSVELAKNETIKQGIAESKIHTKHSTGTRTDALQAKTLMSSLSLKSALVVSDPYNMRRLSMIFNHVFKESDMKLTLVPTDQKRKSPDYWWISPHSFVYVVKEWLKLPMNYYLLNFKSLPTVKSIEEVKTVQEEKLIEKFIEPKLDMDKVFSKDTSHNIFRLIKFKIGEYLVTDNDDFSADTAITPALSSRVSSCYEKGICKKIYLFAKTSEYTQSDLGVENIQLANEKKARELGIDPQDLKIVPHTMGNVFQTTQFLNRFMKENKLKSVKLYLPYYETRKFQFYFKRFLNPEFSAEANPLETRYHHFLDQWLKNTGLGNLYMDQYLIIAHYYFNKFLWSSLT